MKTTRNNMRKLLATLLLAALAAERSAASLSAANNITVGYGEGSPGDAGIQVIITAENDVAIHGYSLALTYPSEALSLSEFTTVGTHVQAIAKPDYSESNLSQPGVGILGVILSFSESGPITLKELPASTPDTFERVIARLTFNVKPGAPGGVYPLRLRDGIGNPATFNRFTSSGTSIIPTLVDGSFTVFGGNVLILDKKQAIPGATPSLQIFSYAQHPEALGGFQIAFTYEKAGLVLPDLIAGEQGHQNASFGTTSVGFLLGQNKVEFFSAEDDTSYSPILARSTCAALFDYVAPFDGQTLPPSTASPPDQSLIRWTFRVELAAANQKEWQDLTLDQSGIPGLVDNRFIIGDRGVDPRLVNGKIYFSVGNLTGRIIDTDTGNGVSGAKVVTDPDGFEATTDGGGNFRMDGIIPGQYTLLVSKTTNPASYYKIRHFKTESGADIVVEGKGNDTGVGSLPIYPVPKNIDPGPRKPFLRAQVNEDNKVDLSDAVALLLYLFRGGSSPSCQQAADTNDDNKLDISDAVYLLSYLFTGGPKPPDPFITGTADSGCTFDPTLGGNLGCEVSSCSS